MLLNKAGLLSALNRVKEWDVVAIDEKLEMLSDVPGSNSSGVSQSVSVTSSPLKAFQFDKMLNWLAIPKCSLSFPLIRSYLSDIVHTHL